MNDWKLTEEQERKFEKYYEFLLEENRKYNLTAITDKDEVYCKHFYDSLELCRVLDFSGLEKLLDIGSGAGFPGIPLKILHPDLNLVIIEPTMKRAKFLAALTEVLGLKGVEIINGRAEDVAGSYRESFPAVTARAVARLPVLLELAMPYVQVGGFFLAMKGASYREEALEAESALKILDSEIVEEHQYSLPNNHGDRVILKIRKNKATKEIYPRKFAAIKKRHL
ncbi:MAG TPA: 16S rRNA (guanine(527)-N(7))-methyltransferase RsmG [Acholeplasmataceae bacterium]|jgi:16S rRNA (guanine527-N7)-methyltransferase|nr:16S rRNA (guanine(527)-N(7))-methyltransferase RsmG [Acholeplasmataceae bacterium]